MGSTSEKTYGSRVYNAEQMSTNVATFTGYVPITPETALVEYNTYIDELKANNTLIASAESDFSLAVDERQDQFSKSPTSLSKLLSPISSYVKAKFGKNSQEAEDIAALVNQIRGESTKKLKRSDDGEFVSNSHRSYGSQTQYLADLIATLEAFGLEYTPTNTSITVANLKLKLEELTQANTQVTTTYSVKKPLTDARITNYDVLSQRSQTIKESVKSQYGLQSSEYKLIKGYNI
ncbi:hypothetical protein QRD02_11230 [Aequorivita sp. SDUM287046]|uniref:Uncharacterized protein n=1 Tax=Aequorivita aurantiaca TaxID=3053356 RepID=A0ABT8DNX9_9FLAO|nr:hypothetical protein [Aequorivita aurantiaca]MDN3724958.1 hypothetical protein [Aequorivita aurantiaca]